MANNKRRVILSLLAAAFLCTAGCSGVYWCNRGSDLADIVEAGAEYPAAGLSIKASFLEAGIGLTGAEAYNDGWARGWGLNGRHYPKSITGRYWGSYDIRARHFIFLGETEYRRPDHPEEMSRSYLGFVDMKDFTRFEIALGLMVQLRAALHFDEFADFILGWTTLDIQGDDTAAAAPQPEPEPPAPEPEPEPAPEPAPEPEPEPEPAPEGGAVPLPEPEPVP